MTFLGLNAFDLVVFAIVVLSGLFALVRGLVKEVLSIVSWVGAVFAALYGFTWLRPLANRLISPPWLADAITGLGLFVVSLIVLGLIASAVSGAIRKTSASALDRSLGFLFGLVRGAVIVCIAWIALSWALPPPEPMWLKGAHTLPLVQRGADLLLGMVPGHAPAAHPNRASAKGPDGRPETGYNEGERRDMNRLIQAIE
jgi:membrane protein required for colicin V production